VGSPHSTSDLANSFKNNNKQVISTNEAASPRLPTQSS